jgi:Spy/CpxP family protein refolding chaperone
MMSYKTGIISLAVVTATVLLLAFTSSAVAERGPEHRPHFGMPGFVIERMAERLDLDETQRQEIENILLAAKPEFEALRDRVKAQVEAVLTEEQLAQLEADKERMQQRLDEAAERRLGLR